MTRSRRRKCRHCGQLFQPDPRNRYHQRYCSTEACRRVSKAASQRRWLHKAKNRDYFRGPENVERVRRWRAAHPGYWRRGRSLSDRALQEDSLAQGIDQIKKSDLLVPPALQDLWASQSLVLLGLIANLTGSSLQDEIAGTGRRLQQLGRDILTGGHTPQGALDEQTRINP